MAPLTIRVVGLTAALIVSTIAFYKTELGNRSRSRTALAFTVFLFFYGGIFFILQWPWEHGAKASVQIALGVDSVRSSPPRDCGDPVEIQCYSESQLQRPLPLKLYGFPGIAHIVYIITDTGDKPIQDVLVRAVADSPGVLLDISNMPNSRKQDMEMIEQTLPRLEPEKIMHSGIQWPIKIEVVDPKVKLFPIRLSIYGSNLPLHTVDARFRVISGDSGEAERTFRRESERSSGMNPNTIGA